MVPSLSTRTQPQQHRPESSSSSSSPNRCNHSRVLKRFTLHKTDSSSTSTCTSSDGGQHHHPSGGVGLLLMKRNGKSRVDDEQSSNHSNASGGGGGIWKSLSALTSHPSHTNHPWALRFKEEGLPHYLHGKSLQGHAVLYIKLHKNRVPDIIKNGCTMEHIEAYFRLMLDYLSRLGSSSSGDTGFVVVVDMKHSKMKHLTGEETCLALKKLEKMCRSPPYPPQMIRRVLLIHAPLWLTSSWPGLKVFVPDVIPIHVVNSAKTHKKLIKYIAQDELPAEFGGKEDTHLGQHESDVELHKLLTKLRGSSGVMTTTVVATTPPPPIEANPSDLSSRATTTRGDESNKASSGGGVVASARNLLTVSLRFHRDEEEKQDTAVPEEEHEQQEGVETVVKSHKNKPKRFLFPKLGRQRRSAMSASNSSKTSSEKSSISTLDGGKRRSMMDDSEESSGVVDDQNDEVVETAGLISSSDDYNQDASIWLPFFKWLSSPEKTSCPSHKTTVYYSSAVENNVEEPIIVPVPLVGVVPPPRRQNKSRGRKKQGLPKPRRRQGCSRKSVL